MRVDEPEAEERDPELHKKLAELGPVKIEPTIMRMRTVSYFIKRKVVAEGIYPLHKQNNFVLSFYFLTLIV